MNAVGGEVCAPDGGKHDWVVDFTTADNANVDNMKVSLETKTASHDWSILDSAYFPPQPPSDQVRLHSEGFDFLGDPGVPELGHVPDLVAPSLLR